LPRIADKTNSEQKKGPETVWVFFASVALHIVILAILCVVHLSAEQPSDAESTTQAAAISRVEQLSRTAVTTPKPKVSDSQSPTINNENNAADEILNRGNSGSILARPKNSPAAGRTVTRSAAAAPSTAFFGSETQATRISYLVDASGSTHGFFSRVRRQLIESISDLGPDQYFAVTFFGNGQIMEFSPGRMLRASPNTKQNATEFINSIGPEGKTSAAKALQAAATVTDHSNQAPEVIYFLTDAFDMTGGDEDEFISRMTGVLKAHAPSARINTIAIWADPAESRMLETLANTTGGDFLCIKAP